MVKLENVSKFYHNEGVVTQGLRRINLDFSIGEFIAITGESGSGKSTLLNVITGFDSYEEGEITINGVETSAFDIEDWEKYRKEMVSFVFQNFNLIDSYTVLKNVEVALIIQGLEKKERKIKALKLLAKVGLTKHINHRASKLSGGERQRLAIARALAMETPFIVADEPTGNLDSESSKEIFNLLSEISKDRLVIVVTHNFEGVKPYATRKIRLFDGEVVEDVKLKEPNKQTKVLKTELKKMNFKQIATISRYNLIEQPKKTLLVTLVSLILISFIFLLYGFFVLTEFSDKLKINNLVVYPERIIVKRIDGEPLTIDDYNYFEENKKIKSIFKEDCLLDLTIQVGRNDYIYGKGNLTFEKFKQSEIVGRLPEAENEILISVFKNLHSSKSVELISGIINEEVLFYFYPNWRYLKVVGIHFSDDASMKFNVHPSLLSHIYKERQLYDENIRLSISIGDVQLSTQNYILRVNPDLKGNQVMMRSDLRFANYEDYLFALNQIEVHPVYVDLDLDEEDPHVISYLRGSLLISEDLYNQLEIDDFKQYTLNLRSPKDAKQIVKTLYEDGYYAFSPYFENRMKDIDNLIMKIVLSIVIFFIISVLYFIAFLIVRTIMFSRSRDYTILRLIGLEQKNIKTLVSCELVSCFLLGTSIFFILLVASSQIFANSVGDFAYNLFISDYIIISLVNILIALLISTRYLKYLKKKSLIINLKGE